ncbi:MAG: hypothetical protein ACLSVG_02515 [Clostridia bacterium]
MKKKIITLGLVIIIVVMQVGFVNAKTEAEFSLASNDYGNLVGYYHTRFKSKAGYYPAYNQVEIEGQYAYHPQYGCSVTMRAEWKWLKNNAVYSSDSSQQTFEFTDARPSSDIRNMMPDTLTPWCTYPFVYFYCADTTLTKMDQVQISMIYQCIYSFYVTVPITLTAVSDL